MIDRCFKSGGRCALEDLHENPDQVFLGIPFKAPYTDIFEYGVRPALQDLGLSPWIAYEHPGIGDLLCKICQGLQTSSAAIIDISEPNPNVHFELGILAGSSKPLILIKQSGTKVPSDLSGMEYTEYSDAKSLRDVLKEKLTLVTTRSRTYPKIAPYATYRAFYNDLLIALETTKQKVDLTHIRDEPPSDFEGTSDWFSNILKWADSHPFGRVRRIISVTNVEMAKWALELAGCISNCRHHNFEVRVCNWRANFPSVNLALFDRRRVFIALTGAGTTETAGFSISEHTISDYFVDYYNNIWSNAVPLKKYICSEEFNDLSDNISNNAIPADAKNSAAE